MAAVKYLPEGDVEGLLEELSQEYKTWIPSPEGDAVVFKRYEKGMPIVLELPPTSPPKEAVFPQTATLLRYRYIKEPEDLTRISVELEETVEGVNGLVFGSRPCGTRGFTIYDRVYDSDRIKDPYYIARRRATTIVSIACTRPENTCFCSTVGGGPADTTGTDLLLVPIQGGYIAEASTEKGEELLLKGSVFRDEEGRAAEATRVKEEAASRLQKAFDLDGIPARIIQLFDRIDFWEEVSNKCISCGACTFLCPTCYCFNITDESFGLRGERMATWDACMFYHFTLEGSGHNPRPTKAHRFRNRVAHKFSYYPDIHGNIIACCGCGRCIKSCPTSVDIREVIIKAKEYPDASEG